MVKWDLAANTFKNFKGGVFEVAMTAFGRYRPAFRKGLDEFLDHGRSPLAGVWSARVQTGYQSIHQDQGLGGGRSPAKRLIEARATA